MVLFHYDHLSNRAIIEVWEWKNNVIPHFSGHVIIYQRWDKR